jgi:hypothetical protein
MNWDDLANIRSPVVMLLASVVALWVLSAQHAARALVYLQCFGSVAAFGISAHLVYEDHRALLRGKRVETEGSFGVGPLVHALSSHLIGVFIVLHGSSGETIELDAFHWMMLVFVPLASTMSASGTLWADEEMGEQIRRARAARLLALSAPVRTECSVSDAADIA